MTVKTTQRAIQLKKAMKSNDLLYIKMKSAAELYTSSTVVVLLTQCVVLCQVTYVCDAVSSVNFSVTSILSLVTFNLSLTGSKIGLICFTHRFNNINLWFY